MHKADAAETLPPHAGDVADFVRAERDGIAKAAHPEIDIERLEGRAAAEAGRGEVGGVVRCPAFATRLPFQSS